MSYQDWVFDLDNTLYPASSSLFPQIHDRMQLFIAQTLNLDLEAALRLQKKYYREYGTTLRGLMQENGLAPDDFLAFVHDIDCTVLAPDPRLDAVLSRLPGRKLIFTNGSANHAENVLRQLGVRHHFTVVFDIKAADYLPKPAIESYRRLVADFAIDPARAVMFEDLARNLTAARELGMTTVWVRQDDHPDGPDAHEVSPTGVDHITDDLVAWLESRLP
jgi:putative hydrolase of the HAD superfamily